MVTHGHAHRCPHCRTSKMCSSDECPVFPGDNDPPAGMPLICAECLGAIECVDTLPAAHRPQLAVAVIVRIVARATRAALDCAAREPESSPSTLARHVDGMLPVDSSRQDPDTLARLGAVAGAKDAWAGSQAQPPACTDMDSINCYVGSYMLAAGVVARVRAEAGQ